MGIYKNFIDQYLVVTESEDTVSLSQILIVFNKYLNEKVLSGNSSGCSDITLQNKTDNIYRETNK